MLSNLEKKFIEDWIAAIAAMGIPLGVEDGRLTLPYLPDNEIDQRKLVFAYGLLKRREKGAVQYLQNHTSTPILTAI